MLRVHVRPAFERERVRARTRGDKVGDWLSPAMKAEPLDTAALDTQLLVHQPRKKRPVFDAEIVKEMREW